MVKTHNYYTCVAAGKKFDQTKGRSYSPHFCLAGLATSQPEARVLAKPCTFFVENAWCDGSLNSTKGWIFL